MKHVRFSRIVIFSLLLTVTSIQAATSVALFFDKQQMTTTEFFVSHQEIPADKGFAAKIYPIVQNLCQKAGMQQPKLYVYKGKNEQAEINMCAYFEGINKPCIAAGQKLLSHWEQGFFTDKEMEAIYAHEMSHLKSHHMIKTLCWKVGIGLLSDPLSLNINLFPLVSCKHLAGCAVDRSYEKAADQAACTFIDDRNNLINALIKLDLLTASSSKAKPSFEQWRAAVLHTDDGILHQVKTLISDHPSLRQRINSIQQNLAG